MLYTFFRLYWTQSRIFKCQKSEIIINYSRKVLLILNFNELFNLHNSLGIGYLNKDFILKHANKNLLPCFILNYTENCFIL